MGNTQPTNRTGQKQTAQVSSCLNSAYLSAAKSVTGTKYLLHFTCLTAFLLGFDVCLCFVFLRHDFSEVKVRFLFYLLLTIIFCLLLSKFVSHHSFFNIEIGKCKEVGDIVSL